MFRIRIQGSSGSGSWVLFNIKLIPDGVEKQLCSGSGFLAGSANSMNADLKNLNFHKAEVRKSRPLSRPGVELLLLLLLVERAGQGLTLLLQGHDGEDDPPTLGQILLSHRLLYSTQQYSQ